MNKSDSERILGMLSHFGYEKGEEDEADFLIINTCSIRKLSEDKAYSKLGVWGKMKKDRPQIKIAICGCVAQQEKDGLLKQFPYLDLVFGTHNIYELPDLLQELQKENKDGSRKRICAIRDKAVPEKEFNIIRSKGINAWLPIMEGCNNFCTYCIVPYVRGRERIRKPEDILQEIRRLVQDGVVEVMLLGQNVNSYGKNLEHPISFAELLQEVEKIEGLERIRFMTSHPKDLSDELIEVMKNSEKICRHMHLPLQSGSSRLLKIMNRRYTKEQYLALVEKLRNAIPDISLTTDIIVGFPGETEEDFRETLDVVRKVRYDSAFTFIYSKRTGTPAAVMENQVPEDVVKERFDRLLQKVQEISKRTSSRFEGQTMPVLVEQVNEQDSRLLTGRLSNNLLVHFPGTENLIGRIIDVKLEESKGFYYMGSYK